MEEGIVGGETPGENHCAKSGFFDPRKTQLSAVHAFLSEKVPGFIKLPEKDKAELFNLIVHGFQLTYRQERVFSGPLPSPEVLAAYEKIYPGFADRIVTMAEKQMVHLHQLEDKVIPEEMKQSGFGQIFGFVIATSGIVASTILVGFDHDVAGSVFGIGSLTSLVGLFLIGKKRQEEHERPLEPKR